MDGFVEEGKKVAKKNIDITLHGLWGADSLSPVRPRIVFDHEKL